MNPRRIAIVLTTVLALLIGAAFLFPPKKEAPEASDPALPARMHGAVSLRFAKPDESFALTLENGVWTLEGDADFPLDQTLCQALADRLYTMKPVETVEGGDRADFGLDPAACTLTAEDTQGTTLVYTFGSYNAYAGLTYFSDGAQVFLIEPSDAQAFLVGPYDLLGLEKPMPVDAQRVTSLSVRTLSGQWRYTLTRENESFTACGTLVDAANPALAYSADPDYAESLVKACSMLYLYECAAYRAQDEALEVYGLRTPTARVELCYRETDAEEESTVVYLFGARDGGRIYVQVEGTDAVYTADENEAAQFLAPDFGKLVVK
ncbi:MAG: DUF4340 domain-containing protein [Oscillospiraceae bacterium]|nr:DUF4340 domain-containing protein [Oscillospiraceae bacterium]